MAKNDWLQIILLIVIPTLHRSMLITETMRFLWFLCTFLKISHIAWFKKLKSHFFPIRNRYPIGIPSLYYALLLHHKDKVNPFSSSVVKANEKALLSKKVVNREKVKQRKLLQVHFLLIYICNFHVLNHFLLIYICKLHWNCSAERTSASSKYCIFILQLQAKPLVLWGAGVHKKVGDWDYSYPYYARKYHTDHPCTYCYIVLYWPDDGLEAI